MRIPLNPTPIIFGIILAVGILGGVWVYGYQQQVGEKNEAERVESLRKEQQKKLGECFVASRKEYSTLWENACNKLELGESCLLPSQYADAFSNGLNRNIELCNSAFGN